VLYEGNAVKNQRTEYMTNFLANCDLYGYCPVLWDCNNMYNRNKCELIDDYKDFFIGRNYEAEKSLTREQIETNAKNAMDTALAAAAEAEALADDEAKAWIMYTSSDWGTSYSVGDVYAPGSATAGLVATDVEITGEGTYTVALDFTGTYNGAANGVTFCALGIGNGEKLFPGYVIHITEIKINGEVVKMTGLPYTTSDNGICTRVNLYNAWVTAPPADARSMMGSAMNCTPTPMDQEQFGQVKTLEITFRYIKK
ncbi:MAG: glycoside hydrolase family 5 protein, partial [Lachnospiraceae bacterium]|nr:glycoside hydrolase family 5 protein [Lachnospiraceae bacterium]